MIEPLGITPYSYNFQIEALLKMANPCNGRIYEYYAHFYASHDVLSVGAVVVQPTTTTVIVAGNLQLGDNPTNVTCPNCKNNVTSVVTKEMGLLVWLIVGFLCIFM